MVAFGEGAPWPGRGVNVQNEWWGRYRGKEPL